MGTQGSPGDLGRRGYTEETLSELGLVGRGLTKGRSCQPEGTTCLHLGPSCRKVKECSLHFSRIWQTAWFPICSTECSMQEWICSFGPVHVTILILHNRSGTRLRQGTGSTHPTIISVGVEARMSGMSLFIVLLKHSYPWWYKSLIVALWRMDTNSELAWTVEQDLA